MKRAIHILLASLAAPALGATVSWDLELEATTWPNAFEDSFRNMVFSGRVDMDRSAFNGEGRETISYNQLLPSFDLTLNFGGQTYDANDDPASGFPRITLEGGELMGFDYSVALDSPGYSQGAFLQIFPDGTLFYSPDGVGEYEGAYQIFAAAVPEPAPSVGIVLMMVGGVTRRRR